jgi:hypothetical protein
MNALIALASKNGPMSIIANFTLVFFVVFLTMSVLACGVYLGELFTREPGWLMFSCALAWIVFAMSNNAFWMYREYSRFQKFLREHPHFCPVQAMVNQSWRADQSGYEVLSFTEGIIHSNNEQSHFTTNDEWAFKRIMRKCRDLNPSFIKAEIPELTFR